MDEIELVIEAPEGATDEEILEVVVALASHADDLHRSLGGGGLKVESVTVEREAG